MNNSLTKRTWHYYAALFISSLCLLIPAFYNHYPLVNPDTATYIESGFLPEMPSDRPITYGLLIRLFTLNGLSLWLLVFVQAFIVSWLIYEVVHRLTGEKAYIIKSMLMVFVLSVGSSLSWIVSQVQPDVFTSIAFLCITVILADRKEKKANFSLYALFFVSVAVHLSHPVLMVASLVFVFLTSRVLIDKTLTSIKKVVTLLILSVLSIVVMLTPLHKSKHIFFMGSLLEKGVLKKYLDDNCQVKSYKLCVYKDSLPADANVFWWDANSPLYKTGDWKSVRPEFNEIIHNIFTTPAYTKLYATATVKQALSQAVTFNIGDGNQSFPEGSYVNKMIVAYFPNELNSFNASTQNKEQILDKVAPANKLFAILVIVCLLAMPYIFARWRNLSTEMKLLLVICLTGTLLNCFDCAAFGIVNGRYGCKMIWLIPFGVLVCVAMNKGDSKIQPINLSD